MAPFWQELRSGRWLTADRTRAYSLILLGLYAIAIVGWIALSDGLIDRNGKPIGTDFSSFYAAGSLVLDGRAGDVYDMAAHFAREQQIFGAATPYYGWLYPPIFLLVATPLALMPYPLALIAWQGATFALYLAVIAAILRKPRRDGGAIAHLWLPVAAASPTNRNSAS
jgi:alpha-1,2-mannosyltransferase